jgi:predicted nucleic acid-binding protein
MTADRDLQFVDTNVLVYAYDQSAGIKHQIAQKLLQELWLSQQGCLSIQILQEFYVTATRRIARPLSSELAEQIVSDLSQWRVHVPTAQDVITAIQWQRRYQISFWDAFVVFCAERAGCYCVWSEELNAGQSYHGVQVLNPFRQPDTAP